MPEIHARSRFLKLLPANLKTCLLLGAVLLIAAVYSLMVPINMPTSAGVFGCGSGFYPPTDPFAKGVCNDLATIQQWRAGALASAALVVGGIGYVFFAAPKDAGPATYAEPTLTDDVRAPSVQRPD